MTLLLEGLAPTALSDTGKTPGMAAGSLGACRASVRGVTSRWERGLVWIRPGSSSF
jgi:hypothetical protein